MKTGSIKATGAILIATLVLVACGKQSTAKAQPTHDAAMSLLTKDVKALYSNNKYEMPAKHGLNGKIKVANRQYHKVYKLRGDLTKAQKKTLTVSKTRIASIKKMAAAQEEIKAVLKDHKVIKDLSYSDTALQDLLVELKGDYPKFVASTKTNAELIHQEVTAIAAVKASTTGQPDQAKIDAAKTAVDKVAVKAFRSFWEPKIPTIENGKLVSKESLTAGTDKVCQRQ